MQYNRWVMKGAMISAALLMAAQAPATAPNSRNKVELLGIKVKNPLTPQEEGLAETVFYSTTLRLLVELPNKQISAIDPEASKVLVFRDDKGTDLTKGKPLRVDVSMDWFLKDYFLEVSSDRHSCGFDVGSYSRPAKGATKLFLKANFVFLSGSRPKTYAKRNPSLKPGAQLAVGPFTLRVGKKKNQSGGIDISLVPPTKQLIDTNFYDRQGRKISHMTIDTFQGWGKPPAPITYRFYGQQNIATIKISYFKKMTSTHVPVDIQTELGF